MAWTYYVLNTEHGHFSVQINRKCNCKQLMHMTLEILLNHLVPITASKVGSGEVDVALDRLLATIKSLSSYPLYSDSKVGLSVISLGSDFLIVV